MFEIYLINLDKKIDTGQFDILMALISEEKQKRIRKFYRYEDALRTLVGEIMIRYLICKNNKFKNRQLVFDKNKYDKPLLKNSQGVHFNISHSGDWVACAIDEMPVGIDIELIRPIDFYIAERTFSKEEFNSLINTPFWNRLNYFYELWTLKESYIKAIGSGLSIPLNSFSIIEEQNSIKVKAEYKFREFFFRKYNIDPEYKMAVCTLQNNVPDNLVIRQFNDVYKDIVETLNL